ncbi:hypothetical protein ATO12_08140 [Aquimarina atlantica]|uniref:N-acetyltransferase domain-containing protein n=1 Tax=Aquimarina atlantica TaxID=1317122 RepID=A0A023BN09_9FLAO|nr:GNAT family N-acetyltransferase [Aquimarina atlantica]EZH71349.1 hypothetical protein ATO12_08140 [Aquimarina atlantica]
MIQIKNAKPEDSEVLFKLIKGLAMHHHQLQNLKTNPDMLAKALDDNNNKFEVLLAYYQNEIAGYLSYYNNYSIWLGKNYLYVDDVFILEKFRSKKIGKALMNRIKEIGKHLEIDSIRWEVEVDNTRAIKFYTNLGADLYNKGIFKWNISK